MVRRRRSNKIGRNDPCWCGSDKKYKRCHLGREAQPELGQQEAIKRFVKRSKKGQCLHPDASPKTCSGRVIKAHTIQRNGGLDHIAKDGHVYNALFHPSKLPRRRHNLNTNLNRVGIGEASTFKGFCSHHDNELFTSIDDKPFNGDIEQIMLLGYRSICHELHSKRFAFDIDEQLKDFDRGSPVRYQQAYQRALSFRDAGIEVSIQELEEAKELYQNAIFENQHENISYYVVFFDKHPDLLCSGICQATHDFRGRELFNLADLTTPASWVAFSLIVSGAGGAAVFSCPNNHKDSIKFLSTLNELPDDDQSHAIVRFAFEFFENTYFSPDWWNGLDNEIRVRLKKRQLNDLFGVFGDAEHERATDCLVDDGIRAVDWKVESKIVSLGASSTSSVEVQGTGTDVIP